LVLLEGVDLSKVEPGRYQLIALPLKLGNTEGAPVRAVLIED
jgi:arylformamidase